MGTVGISGCPAGVPGKLGDIDVTRRTTLPAYEVPTPPTYLTGPYRFSAYATPLMAVKFEPFYQVIGAGAEAAINLLPSRKAAGVYLGLGVQVIDYEGLNSNEYREEDEPVYARLSLVTDVGVEAGFTSLVYAQDAWAFTEGRDRFNVYVAQNWQLGVGNLFARIAFGDSFAIAEKRGSVSIDVGYVYTGKSAEQRAVYP